MASFKGKACVGDLQEKDDELCLRLKNVLPLHMWECVHVCSIEPVFASQTPTCNEKMGFVAKFRLTGSTEMEAKQFVKQFENKNFVTWRVTATNPAEMSAGRKNLFWHSYHCQSSCVKVAAAVKNRQQQHKKRNVNCPASMQITVKSTPKYSRSKDPHMPRWPTIVVLNHNHPLHRLEGAEALKFRDVSDEVELKFRELFANNFKPAEALEIHKHDLYVSHGPEYYRFACDRAHCPDLRWCHYLYKKIFDCSYGPSKNGIVQNLKQKMTSYNTDKDSPIVSQIEHEGQTVIGICTPLMKRVHEFIHQSGELVFMDSSGGVDRCNNRVFILLTHSFAGGLPLGVIISTSESAAAIAAGLELIRDLVGNIAFHGRGSKGPMVFMTDDSASEQHAIGKVFPEATSLLCIFHILQAMWRWLWDSKNSIQLNDRSPLLYLLKRMLYAETKEELTNAYLAVNDDPTADKYPKFKDHLDDKWKRRSQWAISLRNDLPVRGHNTNNISEAAMRVLKDKLLHRTKAFNVIQLVDFMITRLDPYYSRRLIDVASNRITSAMYARYRPPGKDKCDHLEATKLSPDVYEVVNTKKGTKYQVDMSLGNCSCYQGINGGPCKHQYVVITAFTVSSLNFIPVDDPAMKKLLHQVATGSLNIPNDWYDSFELTIRPSISAEHEIIFNYENSENNLICEPIVRPSESVEQQQRSDENQPIDDESPFHPCQQTIQGWMEIANKIKGYLEKSPEVFNPAMKKLFKSFANMHTEAAVATAISTFGNKMALSAVFTASR